MSTCQLALIALAVPLALSSACAVKPQPRCERVAQQKAALLGGAQHAEYLAIGGDTEQAVVHVALTFNAPPFRDSCSGVLLSPSWVLSARHCLHDIQASAVVVSVGPELGAADSQMEASIEAQHPTLDLMLLRLARPASTAGIAPLPAADAPIEKGTLTQLAGYGVSSDGSFGARLFAVEEVRRVDDMFIVVSGFGSSGACGGDSGGPLLVRDARGEPRVAGVLSRGSPDCVGDDRYTRVDIAEDWLSAYVESADPTDGCGDLNLAGRCFDELAVFCERGTRRSERCGKGKKCGFSRAASGFRCVDPESDACEGVAEVGTCNDGDAVRCRDGQLTVERCAVCGATCQRRPQTGAVACTVEATLALDAGS